MDKSCGSQSSKVVELVITVLYLLILLSCGMSLLAVTACSTGKSTPRKYKLPDNLREASGLSIDRKKSLFYLHNDSGDLPNLYAFDPSDESATQLSVPARASDWEDMTNDGKGNFYIADTGNNAGRRNQQTIYQHNPISGRTDSIVFTYPGQNGGGRFSPGNYDCEAIVYSKDHKLHLFTKALPGRRKAYWAYHFELPALPGHYEASLVDSLYLPRRVVTGAALDEAHNELVLITYNYQQLLGFLPFVSSSLITLTDYPEGRFFQGKLERRNLSWALPVQYEAIDFYDDHYLYIATERTILRRQGLRRVKR